MIRFGLWSKGYESLIESEDKQELIDRKNSDPQKYPRCIAVHTVAENWADVVKCGIEYPAEILNSRRDIRKYNKSMEENNNG